MPRLACRIVLSAVASLALAQAAVAQQQQAGVAAAVRGKVEVAERAGAVGRLVTSGEPIFLGNAITSGPDSGMQVMLLDETTFTIGPNSEITIDEFVYDPRSNAGKVTASVAKGVFRFVTGKVAQQDPNSMQVRLPTGNIGIRGTIAMGKVGEETRNGALQQFQQVILVGPGADHEGNNRRGGLVLGNGGGGPPIEIWRSGFASESIGGGAWIAPFQVTQAIMAQYAAIFRAASQQQAQQQGQPPVPPNPNSATAELLKTQVLLQSTQASNAYILAVLSNFNNSIVSIGNQSQQQSTMAAAANDGFSTYEQLRAVGSGTAFWSQSNVPFDGETSFTYNLSLNINFGDRTVGGGTSRVDINSNMPGSVSLPSQSFSSLSGVAQFNYNNLPGFFDPGVCEVSCTVSVQAKPVNSGGVAGQNLQHSVTVLDDGFVSLSGSGTTGPRQPGSAP